MNAAVFPTHAVRVKQLCEVIDARAGERRPPLLAVSIHQGVVPRAELTDDEPRADDLSSYKLCEPGDLVLNRMRAFQGAIGLTDRSGIVSPDYLVLRPRLGAEGRFLHYLFRSPWFVGEMVARLRGIGSTDTGTVRTPRINAEDLFDIRVALPTIAAQRAIADYLDHETSRIDALIAAKRRLVELLEERRADAIGQAVLGFASRDPSMGSSLWAAALPATWPVSALGRCLVRATYGFTNPMPTIEDGPYLLTANDIGDGVIRYATARRTSEEAYVGAITEKSRPRVGDVLVTKDGSLGRVALADGRRACINQSVALLRPLQTVEPAYLVALLRSNPYQQLMQFQAGGTTIKHIYVTRIVKMPIPLPPRSQQREIVRLVRAIDEAHQTAGGRTATSIELLQERRQALITAAVTGELETRLAA